MNYFTTIRKRHRGGRPEWIARLIYRDEATGVKKERSKSAASKTGAKQCEKDLEREFLAGGQVVSVPQLRPRINRDFGFLG